MGRRAMSGMLRDGGFRPNARIVAIASLCLAAMAAGQAFCQEAPGTQAPGKAGSLAVLPYFAPPGALPPQYAFSVYVVTDVIRLTLLEQDRFALVEKGEIDAAAAASGLPARWTEDEALCVRLSRDVRADYLIRGYVAWLGDALKVFHILVDAESGRTLYMAERVLGPGPAIVKDIEDSARDFSLYVSRILPDRQPETLIVETEKVVVKERVVHEASPYSIEAGLAVSFPLWKMADYLAPSGGVRLGFYSFSRGAPGLALGAGIDLFLLNQRQAFFAESGQNIDVLFLPVYMAGRWTALSYGVASVELSAMAGPAVVFGLVSPEIISYFRPALAIGADIVLFPGSAFSVVAGCAASCAFYVYGNLHMLALEPRLLVRFTR